MINMSRVLFPEPLPVRKLLEHADLDLEVIAGEEGLDRAIRRPDLNRPALELAGFFDQWQPERVQVLGTGEMAYLRGRLQSGKVKENLDRIFAYRPPCVVITRGMDVFEEIIHYARKHKVALFRTSHVTTRFIKCLWDHVEASLSPYVVVRGVMMDVYNVGVLISGASSIGKSETALELLVKGHTFVADDLILVQGTQMGRLTGSGRNPIPHHMEIRGIGIIDVSRMYGPRSVRKSKQLDMVIELEDWDSDKDYERLGIDNPVARILDVDIPAYNIPVKPGRNIGTIVEVAVLDHKLRESGIHMAREFDEKLIQAMQKHGKPKIG